MLSYKQQLLDPRWQRRRLEFCQLKNWRCEDCDSTIKTLEVHHCIYLRGTMLWNYPDHLLRLCCCDCHEERQAQEEACHSAVACLLRNLPLQRIPVFSRRLFDEAMEDIHA